MNPAPGRVICMSPCRSTVYISHHHAHLEFAPITIPKIPEKLIRLRFAAVLTAVANSKQKEACECSGEKLIDLRREWKVR
jgi:hypothetical protein